MRVTAGPHPGECGYGPALLYRAGRQALLCREGQPLARKIAGGFHGRESRGWRLFPGVSRKSALRVLRRGATPPGVAAILQNFALHRARSPLQLPTINRPHPGRGTTAACPTDDKVIMASPPLLDLDALLAPIPGDDPAGAVPRAERGELDEARKEHPDPDDPESTVAPDWPKVAAQARTALTSRGKDLVVATRLVEAL